MKFLFVLTCLCFSLSSFASYHFQCFKKMGFNKYDESMQLLIPNLADLTSGASFSGTEDQSTSEDFSFVATGKEWIQMQGINGEILKIQSRGNQRVMKINRNDKDTEVFNCFIESSI
jgi:hypothetical protein